MILVLEISGPFQWKMFIHNERTNTRICWLWFAIVYIKISYQEWVMTSWSWKHTDGSYSNSFNEFLQTQVEKEK